ncbi:MAG: hypothetical protein DRO05_04480, partial [Thermoproteota archaeon]
MIERTIQKVGGSSYTVTLPKFWIKKHGIGKGSKVLIEEGVGGALIITPAKPRELAVAKVIHEDVHATARKIFAAYLEGYDVIEVIGRPLIKSIDRKEIKKALLRLPGLEIVEEDSGRIVLKCVLNPSMLEPWMLFERMKKLVSSMMEDLLKAAKKGDAELASLVIDRDDEVDRAYFLLVRVVRKTSQDAYLMRMLKIDPVQLIDLRVASMLLEVVADRLAELAELLSSGSQMTYIPKKMGSMLLELQRISVESVIRKDISLAVEGKEKAQKLLKMISEELVKSKTEPGVLFALREVIARLG